MTDLRKEYLDFMKSKSRPPVDSLAYQKIMAKLNPPPKQVLITFLTVTLVSSFLTLIICPQFGLGGFLFGHEIVHIAMAAGEFACGAFCAFIFFGFSLLVSHFVLPPVYRTKVAGNKLVAALLVPAVVMFFAMISAVLVGEFVFMGLVYTVAWYATSAGLHLGAVYIWRRHAVI